MWMGLLSHINIKCTTSLEVLMVSNNIVSYYHYCIQLKTNFGILITFVSLLRPNWTQKYLNCLTFNFKCTGLLFAISESLHDFGIIMNIFNAWLFQSCTSISCSRLLLKWPYLYKSCHETIHSIIYFHLSLCFSPLPLIVTSK